MIEMPELDNYLPHTATMLLLDRITDWNIQSCTLCSEVAVTEDSLFYNEEHNGVPAWVGFEYMAQSIAALSGLHARKELGKPPKVGFIMSIRNYTAEIPFFPAGQVLRIGINQIFNENSVVSFDCTITADDKTLVTATVNAIETENPESIVGAL